MLEKLERKYFDIPLSRGFVSLYTGRTISLISAALLGLFLPIFLYNLFNQNFQAVVIYYAAGFSLFGITISFGSRFLNKFGFRRALQVSVILAALFYTIFYFINKDNLVYLIPLSIFTLVFFRLFHWLPFHVDFAKFTNKKTRARQVSMLSATRMILGVFIPIISGFIIVRFGFDVLFVIAIILWLVSGIPYLTLPRTKEKFSWSLKKTWQEFFSKERRKMVLVYMADGAENMVGLVVWPIFIFQVLKGNYFQVGAISTLIIGFTVSLQLVIGKLIDVKISKKKALKWGTLLYSSGWVIKIFVSTAFQIFIAGAYHSVTDILLRTPFDALTYEIAADQGHYVDEFTVLREMALQSGRLIMAVLIIIVSLSFAIQWVFALAALVSIVFNLLEKGEIRFSR